MDNNYISPEFNSITRDSDTSNEEPDNSYLSRINQREDAIWADSGIVYEALTENAPVSLSSLLKGAYKGSKTEFADIEKEIGHQVMKYCKEYIYALAKDDIDSGGIYDNFDMNDTGE